MLFFKYKFCVRIISCGYVSFVFIMLCLIIFKESCMFNYIVFKIKLWGIFYIKYCFDLIFIFLGRYRF